MQSFKNGNPYGAEEFHAMTDIERVARRMFDEGADEVRIKTVKRDPNSGRKLTKPIFNRAKRNIRNKAARIARKLNRKAR